MALMLIKTTAVAHPPPPAPQLRQWVFLCYDFYLTEQKILEIYWNGTGIHWKNEIGCTVLGLKRFCGVMVSIQHFESCDPSSTLGRTYDNFSTTAPQNTLIYLYLLPYTRIESFEFYQIGQVMTFCFCDRCECDPLSSSPFTILSLTINYSIVALGPAYRSLGQSHGRLLAGRTEDTVALLTLGIYLSWFPFLCS